MNTQLAYEGMRAYFSRPDAVLAKTIEIDDFGDEAPSCRYRDLDGNACAAGCLIPPALYKETFEGTSITALTSTRFTADPELKRFFADTDTTFLSKAQNLHDCESNDAKHFVEQLDELAADYGLELVEA